MKEDTEFYTIEDLAKILQFSYMTIFRWMKQGKLKFGFKVGGSWRFLKKDFNVWIERMRARK